MPDMSEGSIMTTKCVTLLLLIFLAFSTAQLTCKDFEGNVIEDGLVFKPDASDLCKECTCHKGYPTMCRSVSCSPPSCPHWEQIKTECCQFTCLDTPTPPTDTPKDTNSTGNTVTSSDSLTTLGLRLVASTVTSFLVLALLLFAVHQLRRKRLILAMRRYGENRRRADNYQPDMFTPDYFGMECPPYEEPPPPYSPPKPQSETHPVEAPPPYDSVDANHNVSPNVLQDRLANHYTSPRQLARSGNSVTENTAAPVSSLRSSVSPRRSDSNIECQNTFRSIDQNLSLQRQSTHPLRNENFTLPPWNSFRTLRGDNHHNHSTLPGVRRLERGISENSDIISDRASTDFGLTSDAETHFNRCDSEENVVLRDLRLSSLLSSPNESRVQITSNAAMSPPNGDLQNDAHYPENNFSNSNLHQAIKKTVEKCCDNSSPEHNRFPLRRKMTPPECESDSIVIAHPNGRNTYSDFRAHSQNVNPNNNRSSNDRIKEQNCSVV